MEIQSIDFELTDEGLSVELSCPACGKPWLKVEKCDGGLIKQPECPHVRFALEPDSNEIKCFNGFALDELIVLARSAARRYGEDRDDESVKQFILRNRYEDSLWSPMESPKLDTLVKYSQEGIACGPVSYTICFGAKFNA